MKKPRLVRGFFMGGWMPPLQPVSWKLSVLRRICVRQERNINAHHHREAV